MSSVNTVFVRRIFFFFYMESDETSLFVAVCFAGEGARERGILVSAVVYLGLWVEGTLVRWSETCLRARALMEGASLAVVYYASDEHAIFSFLFFLSFFQANPFTLLSRVRRCKLHWRHKWWRLCLIVLHFSHECELIRFIAALTQRCNV